MCRLKMLPCPGLHGGAMSGQRQVGVVDHSTSWRRICTDKGQRGKGRQGVKQSEVAAEEKKDQ